MDAVFPNDVTGGDTIAPADEIYVFLHFMAFFWFDHFFDVQEMLKDVAKRPFSLVGFAAFLLLIPLVVTSTNGMVKRLGAKRWQWLHWLIYVIVPLGLLHFWRMRAGKPNFTEPVIFAVIVGVLLLVRVVWVMQKCAQEQASLRSIA